MEFSMRAVSIVSMVWMVSVAADTGYQPPKTEPGPYPPSGVPASAYQPNKPGSTPYQPSTPATRSPYPPSGWKPSGRLFPVQPGQSAVPAPSGQGYPNGFTEFGVETEFTTVEPVTSPRPEPESENLNEFGSNAQIPDHGTYYVLLPDGRLQKVSYATMPLVETGKFLAEPDNQAHNQQGYLANIKYQDVEPIRGPIYAYNSAPLIRIFK